LPNNVRFNYIYMGHVERKQREREKVRDNIINAAVKIAIAEGWQSVTIRKIADSIEYTPPIVYEHFENKEDLFKELVLYGFSILHALADKSQSEELSPREQLINLSLAHWDFAFANKELFQLMFSLERLNPNEEVMKRGFKLYSIFTEISGKSEKEAIALIFNWMCLVQGTISVFMHFEGTENLKYLDTDNTRELFVDFIKRFISSISKT